MKQKPACPGRSSECPYTEKPIVFRGQSLMSEDGLSDSEFSRQPGSSYLPIMVLMAGVPNYDSGQPANI